MKLCDETQYRKPKKTPCTGCPYGRVEPCIGWEMYLQEMLSFVRIGYIIN